MPTYDYRCNNCEHEFELFQSMKDSVKKKCPECGKLALERLIGLGAGVIFKGSGFYETDYRSESYKKGAEADKKAKSGGDDRLYHGGHGISAIFRARERENKKLQKAKRDAGKADTDWL